MGGKGEERLCFKMSLLGLPARLQNQYNVKNPACQYKCAVLAQIFLAAREMAQGPQKVRSQLEGPTPRKGNSPGGVNSQEGTLKSWAVAGKLGRLTSIGKPQLQSSSTIKAWSDAPLGRTYSQTPGHCEGKPPFSKRVLASPWVDRSPDLITMARSS